jgi:sec-independent protein translocase protein TatA
MTLGPQELMYFGNPWQLLLVLLVVMVLFGGKGKVSDFMGDFAKGIKAFKKGLADDDQPQPQQSAAPQKALDQGGQPQDVKSSHETRV